MLRFLFCLLLLWLWPTPARGAEPAPRLMLYPIVVDQNAEAAESFNAILKISLMAERRYIVEPQEAPPTYDGTCIRSILCLRQLAKTHPESHMMVGSATQTPDGHRLYLVLFDPKTGSALKTSESKVPIGQLGQKLPSMARRMVQDMPLLPAGVATAKVEAKKEVLQVEQRVTASLEDDFSVFKTEKKHKNRLYLSLASGYAYTVGEHLFLNALDLQWQNDQHWAVSLNAGQLNGLDNQGGGLFFLPTLSAQVTYQLWDEAIHPFMGLEIRNLLLAKDIAAAGGAVVGGLQMDLTHRWSARAHISAGALRNEILPQTIWGLGALQPYLSLQANLMMRLF